ncbi:MAG: HD domain-containing protein [bacterium]|nr:HD domain-containing protein [bacterium]
MKIPTREQAHRLLDEGYALNPGPWRDHVRFVGEAARAIAQHHPDLDPEIAYIMGCMHDIGRREGVTGMRHVIDGYTFLIKQGFEDAARICLTHSFPLKNTNAVFGEWDCTPEERRLVDDFIANIEYTDYDRLLQLCDALALPSGFCLIEKRFVDVAMRYGPNQYTVPKWTAVLNLRDTFSHTIGRPIYSVLPGIVQNTFGFDPTP